MYHNFGHERTKRDIVTVCNSCIFLSVLSKQMLETVCQDKIFKEIGGRNHLNLVNNEILMFLMIKRVSKRLLERSEQQNWFRGFQIMCKDEIFKEIGGRNHLNFVNNEILMFLMIKDSQNTCQREVNNKIGSEAFRSCARTNFLRKLVVEIN